MAKPALEGSQPVDLSKHPSGIVPTLQSVLEQKVNNNLNLQYARIIQKLGFPAKFKIQNIVGSCDVKFLIRLEGLAYSHGAFSSYEPELFPSLIYRMKQPKIVLLIFASGESIPVRLFLTPYELTPTYRNINNKFSIKYYLNLVLVDEEDRRYFK